MTLHGTSVISLFMALTFVQPAVAHSIHLHAVADDEFVRGRVTFTGDEPGAGMTVMVFTQDGEPVATVQTDADGRFTYPPELPDPLQYIVETVDGHRALQIVGLMPPGIADGDRRQEALDLLASESDVYRVMEKLDRLERRTRTRDVLAGIGYILGVMGLIAFWKSRSSKSSS